MDKKTVIELPVNRVEGDLEVRVEIQDGVITDAWSSGLMYRGFEKILSGRRPLDGLVITPRICGICTTAHLSAAAMALDMIFNITPPKNAILIRNLAMMTEYIQSDIRHGFLMFMPDFLNPAYEKNPYYGEAIDRYQPLKGRTAQDVIKETKKFLKIIAILGGQWPHSSYMVPGGVVCTPNARDMLQCRLLLQHYRKWYEDKILGCTLERWKEVKNPSDLNAWLDENPQHRESELGFFIRYAQSIGLDRTGKGYGHFICFGSLPLPDGTEFSQTGRSRHLFPSGFARGTDVEAFDQGKIAEHVAYSWFKDYAGGKHPFQGETLPYATGEESTKYSWAKAPRYDGLPAETGPLAEMVLAGNPLFVSFIKQTSANVFVRELARLVRSVELIPVMEKWISDVLPNEKFYLSFGDIQNNEGYGLTQATRGALGHWVKMKDNKIESYQIITPTAWNASPRDSSGMRGPWEEALIGTEIKDKDNPVELGHIIRSYDACLVCTVH